MDFELGDRVLLKRNSRTGFVHGIRSQRCPLIEVRWEDDGVKQWLPAEEFRAWDKVEKPIPPTERRNGSTAPAYLAKLRSYERKPQSTQQRLDNAAEAILRLSGKRRKRSRNKTKKVAKKLANAVRMPNYKTLENCGWSER